MHYKFLFSLFVTLTTFQMSLSAQYKDSVAYIRHIVQSLTADSLTGRSVSSEGEKRAAAFIFSELQGNKRGKVKYQRFSFHQADNAASIQSVNVFAYVNNHADSTILLSAHYDHLGMGGPLSKSLLKTGLHPGADDNASGVSLLLSLYRDYLQWGHKKYNYLFVAYSAHEVGLHGSKAFHHFIQKRYPSVCLAINFDMVGRLNFDENIVNVYGTNTLTKNAFYFTQTVGHIRYRLSPDADSLIYQLDTKPFAEKGIPCLSFSTGIHTDYHKVTDTPDKINYQGILKIKSVVEQFIKYY